MTSRRWSNAEISRLHKLLEGGWTIRQAAKLLDRPYRSVYSKWFRIQHPSPKRFRCPEHLKAWYVSRRRHFGLETARGLLAKKLKVEKWGVR